MATRVKLTMKTCSKCGLLLPASEFNKDRSKRDGLDTYCRVCRHEYMKTYQPKQRERRWSTPESRDSGILAAMRARHATESEEPPYSFLNRRFAGRWTHDRDRRVGAGHCGYVQEGGRGSMSEYTGYSKSFTVTYSTDTAAPSYRPLGTWCWKANAQRRDLGCLHCEWSLKIGANWFCFYPRKVE